MDARVFRGLLVGGLLFVAAGARFPTPNFVVETADPRLAREFALTAEKQRRELAVSWLGETMPNWAQPCLVTVQVGSHLGAGGATTFYFDQGEVFGWRMTIQGSRERVLDSVLPHEITHMILASHFRCPLPRWADEGAATSVEHVSERNKHRRMLYQFLRTGRGIAFNQLFAMREYPADIMPMYAQSHSLAEYLIQVGGRRKYIQFIGDGMKDNDWCGAVERHYGIADSGALQQTWLGWVKQGCPNVQPEARPGVDTIAVTQPQTRPVPNLIHHVPQNQPASYAPGSVTPIADIRSNPRTPPRGVPNEPVRQLASTDGWHAAGQRSLQSPDITTAPTVAVSPAPSIYMNSHVTKPQPTEPSQQIILDWGGR